MKVKKSLAVSVLVVLMGLVAGCHYQSLEDYSGYGSGYGSYRDGYRDGRAYERRREGWGYSRYDDRYGYYRRR